MSENLLINLRRSLYKFGSPVVLASLLVLFQNCSPGTLDTTSNPSKTEFVENDGSVTPIQDSKTVAVNYSENLLVSMLNQTGVQTPSQNTNNAYQRAQGMVSETGKADAVTAPMWNAVTSLSGDVCLDLINQEKALDKSAQRIFPQVNFSTGPQSLTNAAKENVVRRLARSVWGRNETTQERALIVSATNEAFSESANQGAQTENALLFICTSMLASLDAHKH